MSVELGHVLSVQGSLVGKGLGQVLNVCLHLTGLNASLDPLLVELLHHPLVVSLQGLLVVPHVVDQLPLRVQLLLDPVHGRLGLHQLVLQPVLVLLQLLDPLDLLLKLPANNVPEVLAHVQVHHPEAVVSVDADVRHVGRVEALDAGGEARSSADRSRETVLILPLQIVHLVAQLVDVPVQGLVLLLQGADVGLKVIGRQLRSELLLGGRHQLLRHATKAGLKMRLFLLNLNIHFYL